MSVFDLVPERVSPSVRACYAVLDPAAPEDYRQLAAILVDEWRRTGACRIGIGAGQGAGKTTLCGLIEEAGAHFGETVATLGIDDFYLTKDERRRLARDVHPLFETRGPPRTHDIDLLLETTERLLAGEAASVPVFDKGIDDRNGARTINAKVDRVIVEGWCVGARPQPSETLLTPVNELERAHDSEGVWRRAVNDALEQSYARMNESFDCLAFLAVPGIESVRRWRLDQERERPEGLRLNAEAIARFVAHYERLTNWMLEDVVRRADVVVRLGPNHAVSSLAFN